MILQPVIGGGIVLRPCARRVDPVPQLLAMIRRHPIDRGHAQQIEHRHTENGERPRGGVGVLPALVCSFRAAAHGRMLGGAQWEDEAKREEPGGGAKEGRMLLRVKATNAPGAAPKRMTLVSAPAPKMPL